LPKLLYTFDIERAMTNVSVISIIDFVNSMPSIIKVKTSNIDWKHAIENAYIMKMIRGSSIAEASDKYKAVTDEKIPDISDKFQALLPNGTPALFACI